MAFLLLCSRGSAQGPTLTLSSKQNWQFFCNKKYPVIQSSNTLATWCKELTYWKRLWCWVRLKPREESGADRRWDGWMASLTQWTWVLANSRRQWRTGKLGMLQFVGLQRVGHDSDWTKPDFGFVFWGNYCFTFFFKFLLEFCLLANYVWSFS